MSKRNLQQQTPPSQTRTHARPPDDECSATAKGRPGTESEADWHAQLAEDRASTVDADAPGQHPVGAASSANSVSADPFARNKSLGAPVPQVTRHI